MSPDVVVAFSTGYIHKVISTLETISYYAWSKTVPASVLQTWTDQLIETLRPKSKLIASFLFAYSSHYPSRHIDEPVSISFDRNHYTLPPIAILRGAAAQTLASLSPSLNSNAPWLIPVLVKMMSESMIEQVGAISIVAKSNVDVDENVVNGLVWVLQRSFAKRERRQKQKHDVDMGMTMRVSIWRSCLKALNKAVMRDGKVVRGRRWCASQSVVESVLGILRFLDDSVKVVDGKGTAFSGPGLFQKSGFAVHDCAHIVRSVIYFLRRLAVVRDNIRSYMIHRGELIGWCKRLGAVFADDDTVREDLVEFLLSLGIGSSMAQIPPSTIKQMLISQSPRDVLRGLKILARTGELVDAETFETFVIQHQGVGLLLSLIDPAHQYPPAFNDACGPNVKIQRDPLRDATIISPNLTWRMVIRSIAMNVLSRAWKNGCMYVIKYVWKNAPWLVDFLGSVLKKGSDLERWGAVSLLDAVLASSHFYNCSDASSENLQLQISTVSFAFVLIKMLNHSFGNKQKVTILDLMNDLQWRFEFWTSSINVLSFMIHNFLLDVTAAHQAGLVPSLFAVLNFVYSIHNEKRTSDVIRKKRHFEMRYSLDETLPDLVYSVLRLLCDMSSDKLTRDIILWDAHVMLLSQFTSFFDLECRETLHTLFEIVTTSLSSQSVNEKNIAVLKSLSNSVDTAVFEVWPLKMNNDIDPLHVLTTQPEIYQFAFSKACAGCHAEETRCDQFLKCTKCQPITWYCSRACMIADKKQHAKECLGNVRVHIQSIE